MGLADYRDLKVPALLRQAIEVLNEKGWAQGVTRTDLGAVDLWGAVLIAADVSPKELDGKTFPDSEDLVAPVKTATVLGAQQVLQGLVSDIAGWNDQPGRTQDEVTALLRRAADMVDIAVS